MVVGSTVVVCSSVEVMTVEVNDEVSPVVVWMMDDVVSACVVLSMLVVLLTLASVVASVVSTDATVVLTLSVVVVWKMSVNLLMKLMMY